MALLTQHGAQFVVRVDHLRIRVDMDPGNYDDGDSVTLSVLDADGDFAGKAVVAFQQFPSENVLETTIYNSANVSISSDIESFFQQVNVSDM